MFVKRLLYILLTGPGDVVTPESVVQVALVETPDELDEVAYADP